jgi:hypothetical protein
MEPGGPTLAELKTHAFEVFEIEFCGEHGSKGTRGRPCARTLQSHSIPDKDVLNICVATASMPQCRLKDPPDTAG